MSRIIFCGPYYNPKIEKDVIKIGKGKINNASNKFQSALIEGLKSILKSEDLLIINTIPVGTWPNNSNKLVLSSGEWMDGAIRAFEVGCINLPIIKQLDRERRLYNYLKRIVKPGDIVLLYSCYLPFMNAIHRLKNSVHFSIIVTDLPEFYDLERVSFCKKVLRRINNSAIYKKLQSVDSFVLLTEQMKKPLNVGNRPYTIIEGIYCDSMDKSSRCFQKKEKKIIFYSGTLHYQFGIQYLLDSFKRLNGDEYELWICGAGEAADAIKTLAKEDPNIKYFGFCDSKQVAELREQASVLVNPRPIEGEYTKYSFPSKTMEYLASGIPVVMYRLPGIPTEYDDLIYYIDGTDEDSLCRVINKVCSLSNEELQSYSIRAKTFIKEQKNEVVQVGKILKLINIR